MIRQKATKTTKTISKIRTRAKGINRTIDTDHKVKSIINCRQAISWRYRTKSWATWETAATMMFSFRKRLPREGRSLQFCSLRSASTIKMATWCRNLVSSFIERTTIMTPGGNIRVAISMAQAAKTGTRRMQQLISSQCQIRERKIHTGIFPVGEILYNFRNWKVTLYSSPNRGY